MRTGYRKSRNDSSVSLSDRKKQDGGFKITDTKQIFLVFLSNYSQQSSRIGLILSKPG